MTLGEWADQIRARKKKLVDDRQRDALVLAQDLLTLVQLRIQTSGQDSQNRPLSPYSPEYAKKRREAGYQTRIVDYTRTGQMWRSVSPRVIAHDVDTTIVEIAARTADGQTKLDSALRQPKNAPRGNLLVPSADEVAIVNQANLRRVLRVLQP